MAAQAVSGSSAGRNDIPTAKVLGRRMPTRSPHMRKKHSGIGTSSPAPSPLNPSASTPPRCERRTSAVSARSITSRLARFPRRATNPTPHASKSTGSEGGRLPIISLLPAARGACTIQSFDTRHEIFAGSRFWFRETRAPVAVFLLGAVRVGPRGERKNLLLAFVFSGRAGGIPYNAELFS
jgi:hypothetical protein